jgi:hypothetical protein
MARTVRKKKLPLSLSTEDLLAMYRCAMFTAMGVVNAEPKPTGRQCIEWLNRVVAQAEHRTDPPITLMPHSPGSVKSQMSVLEIVILRWDARIALPDWRDIPR